MKDETQEGLELLLPCPFCGGTADEFRENGRMWSGQKYTEPTSVSVWHWCELPGPTRSIERIGRDKAQAIERWNMRAEEKPKC